MSGVYERDLDLNLLRVFDFAQKLVGSGKEEDARATAFIVGSLEGLL